MNARIVNPYEKPLQRPCDPKFSCGPCRKHPGWDPANFSFEHLGLSHRAAKQKSRLKEAVDRSSKLLGLPQDWQVAIVPASDTGAFELAMWSMLGARGVDVFAWERFSNDWADDIQNQLKLNDLNIYQAEYGELADLTQANPGRDIVFAFNGTTSGVRVPDLDWIERERGGLVFCDATSAVFAMKLDYQKLDVVTWSWQKVLGSEAGFGMLALSPKAIERLESYKPERPLPKIFRIANECKIDPQLFEGSTLNTPSMLALEDLHSALNWAESIGGLPSLIQRVEENFNVVNGWVSKSDWVSWLAKDPKTRSTTSMCLKITIDEFTQLNIEQQRQVIDTMCQSLEEENVAFDIASYRTAPPGFRLWGGATVESNDLKDLLPWLDWVFHDWLMKR